MTDLRNLLALTAECDRRNLLELGGKELAAELTRRTQASNAAVDAAMVQAKAHYSNLNDKGNKNV